MTRMMDPIVAEFREETAITRRVLNRVPADKLSWKPHVKSMSLGQLAFHVAVTPARVASILQHDEFEVDARSLSSPEATTAAEINKAFEESVESAETFLTTLSEEAALRNFQLKVNGRMGLNVPKKDFVRQIMLNHVYHHRGQLSVYLRLLDMPVPVIYGRSADEGPGT
jgi:uncharacterized damage-inducible protein DinB